MVSLVLITANVVVWPCRCMVEVQHLAGVFPLIIDPTGSVWQRLVHDGAVAVHYHDTADTMTHTLARALVRGGRLVVHHVDMHALWTDARLIPLLQRRIVYNSRHVKSVVVGNDSVEVCSVQFYSALLWRIAASQPTWNV